MAYVSLYRKYRPQTFADVVGQRHVTQTLVNAIDEDRLHHAYLFTGPRGTGKTSTARILAKAINCAQGPTSTPCNDCDLCQDITTGSSVDVIELDMASHGGVDDARELRDRALFAPARGRKKVYILDEVHMASTAAFNALLKLIEEPPDHVLFAMATTDPQKVIPTIMSRVQRLDLRRVSAEDVAAHVRSLTDAEGASIDDGALEAVVRAGDGSVRDALSVLEQVLAFGGATVTADHVAQVLGHTPTERTFEAVRALGDRDLAALLGLVQGLLDDGHDLRRFTFDLLAHLRDLLVLQAAPDRPDLVDATRERRERLAAQSRTISRETLLRAVGLLAETVTEQRQGPARLPLELALAKLAVPGAGGDVEALADRVARLEQQGPRPGDHAPVIATDPLAADGAAASPPAASDQSPRKDSPSESIEVDDAEAAAQDGPAPSPPAAAETPSSDPGAPAPAPAADAAEAEGGPGGDGPDDGLTTVVDRWAAVLEAVKGDSRRIHAVYEPAQPIAVTRGVLTLRYPARYASFHAQNARKGQFAEALRAAVSQVCDLRVSIDAVVEGDEARRPMPPVVTPDDAVMPDTQDSPAPAGTTGEAAATGQQADAPAEDEDVREAELAAPAGDADPDDTDALLARELGAERVDDDHPDDA